MPYNVKGIRAAAHREIHKLALSAACARSHTVWVCGERVRQSESMYTQQVDKMSRIVAHNRLCDGSLENTTCARGTDQPKLNGWREKISIVFGPNERSFFYFRTCKQNVIFYENRSYLDNISTNW